MIVRPGDQSISVGERLADSHDPIGSAVLSTLGYSDIFGYPLTLQEVHRYLEAVVAERDAVRLALEALLRRRLVLGRDGLFALADREYLFEQRRRREAVAKRLWPTARWYARALASIATVRMIGVTGSLATGNTADDADIDFMLLTEGGALWRTRAAAKVLQQLSRRSGGHELCVNYLRSERALELASQDLYTARELTQMVPLYGPESYEELRRRNAWTHKFLPNAAGPPAKIEPISPFAFLRPLSRAVVLNPIAARLEQWEGERKIRKYNETSFLPSECSEFTREATGHRLDVKRTIARAHEARLSDQSDAARFRVLIGQAYHLALDRKLWREMRPYPPLGSLYAAAVVRRAGYEVGFFDSMLATEQSSWIAALDRHRPDVVVLFEDNFNYLTKMCLSRMRDAAVEMIKAARRIGKTVLVCSSDATDNADRYLDAGAAFVIRGEGEAVLTRLLDAIARSEPGNAAEIRGLTYRTESGTSISTPRMAPLRSLDDLPHPAWDLIDLERYARIWRRLRGYVSINLATTRGCPYHCNWCAKPIWGQGYNVRSPEHVVDEIALLRSMTPIDHIWFMDDIFGLKPGWIARLADCLEVRQIKIKFKCLTRPDLLHRPGEIEALKRAGCETVWIGAESGSQKVLDAMEKGTRVEQIEGISTRLRASGIRVGYFIQFGYPGEGWSDIRKTRALIRRTLPDELGVSVSYPLPGTKFFARVRHQLGETQNWTDSEDLAMLFRGPFRTAFYRALHGLVHRELAWHRLWHEIATGSLRRLAPRRRLRRLAFFVITSVLLPCDWLCVVALSLLPNRGCAALPVALDQAAAARPSPQAD